MKRSLAGTSAIAAVVVGLGVTPASAEIPVPPDNSVQVYNLKTSCQVIDSFATVSSNPTIRWSKAPVSYNARYGILDYRTRVTVRVIRNVTLGVDTTAWKGYYWDTFPAVCTGRGGA